MKASMYMLCVCACVLLLCLVSEFLLLFQQSQQSWIFVAAFLARLPPSYLGPCEHPYLEGSGETEMTGLFLT